MSLIINNLTLEENRKKFGLTQEQLALEVGVSRKTINSYENEGSIPASKIKLFEQFFSKMSKNVTSLKGSPLLPIEAVAGFKTVDNEGISYEDCEHYVVPEFDKRGMEFLIRVSGSSMYPKYSNGDILACKKIKEITFFQWGKIYVIDSNQGALVKRVFEDKESKDNIICVSDNKENYPPFIMPKDDIRSLSIVLGVVRME